MKLICRILSVVSLFALTASGAFAADWDVDCGGGGDVTTIQEAVDAAAPYDTITVWPCDYDETVTIPGNNAKDGLTIQSTEVAALGPNTQVREFNIGWAPDVGSDYVTIKGFTIGDNMDCGEESWSVGIESSGDYNTIAHNYVTDCPGDAAIRVNRGNMGNNVHHNVVEDTDKTGIKIESGENHNVHQNFVDGAGWKCIHIEGPDFSVVHQNGVDNCAEQGIDVCCGSDDNQFHHNVVCDAMSFSSSSDDNFIHHNFANSLSGCSGNKCKKNTVEGGCPFDD